MMNRRVFVWLRLLIPLASSITLLAVLLIAISVAPASAAPDFPSLPVGYYYRPVAHLERGYVNNRVAELEESYLGNSIHTDFRAVKVSYSCSPKIGWRFGEIPESNQIAGFVVHVDHANPGGSPRLRYGSLSDTTNEINPVATGGSYMWYKSGHSELAGMSGWTVKKNYNSGQYNLFNMMTDLGNGCDSPTYLSWDMSEISLIMVGEPKVLLDRMVWSAWPECPVCDVQNAVHHAGGPVNTRNGNLSYQKTDLSIPIMGGSLEFRRAYASGATEFYTATLGRGWTHNYAMRLDFDNTALSDTVEFQAQGGSRFPFFCSPDCADPDVTFTPYPGVTAALSRINLTNPITTQFVITGFNQMTYTFNYQGLLLKQTDPYGNAITFTYSNGQLLEAVQGDRFLKYEYENGRLVKVRDNISRTVSLYYQGPITAIDLVSVTLASPPGATVPLTLTTSYGYSGTTHLLTTVTDPSGKIVEQTTYAPFGNGFRATEQRDGEGRVLVKADYSLTNTHVISESGVVMTYTYDTFGTLVDARFACTDGTAGCQTSTAMNYDYNFNPWQVVDGNLHPTNLFWNSAGSSLEKVEDPLANATSMEYDSLNNLTQVVNARSLTTTYTYTDTRFPTFRTSMTDANDKITFYRANENGLLAEKEDPTGRLTTYAYNAYGQITQTVRAAGTADALTTTYGYDAAGRLITATQVSAAETITSLNVYDPGDRLIATIENWTGMDRFNWSADCDRSPGPRDTNVCTTYDYDDAGRPISTTNALGQTDLTFYDDAGRVVTSVVNYDGATPDSQLCTDLNDPDPEYNLCSLTGYDEFGRVVSTTDSLGHVSRTEYDSVGRVKGTIQNSVNVAVLANCTFTIAPRDQDLCTLYEYDPAGNTIIVTDPAGRQTRTLYDALNRVVGTVQNWSGTIDTLAELQSCLTPSPAYPAERDTDVCTGYKYDEVGNTTVVTDSLGRLNATFYDELNRVKATVANWQGASSTITGPDTLDNCFDLPAERDTDVCTVYGYDPAGNQITVTNALTQTSLTVYDSANRPAIQVQNWNGAVISTTDTTNCADTAADPTAIVNLCTFTGYDGLGRRAVVTDTMGLTTTFEYDGLGRLVTSTRFLDSQPVISVTRYDALGNRLGQTDALSHTTTYQYDSLNRLVVTTSPEGVAITQTYNAAGWVLTTTNSLDHETVNDYDGLGRVITTTDALSHTTTYVYDALGNQTAMIDAEGITTTYGYDDLNRLAAVIENDTGGQATNDSNLLTQYAYDVLGNQVVITNARVLTAPFTLTAYDGLNRPVTVTDAVGITTTYGYDALGNRISLTDGNEEVTLFDYDALNRLVQTDYLSDTVTVSYRYDAAGNRLVMTDSLGVTSYEYDDLYRLITVTNPFTDRVVYGYDLVGNRTNLTYPDDKVVTYTYNMDSRLKQVEDWDNEDTRYGYDAAGRLITATLPNGVKTSYEYDDANRLTGLVHRDESDTLLASFEYQLDQVGNRIVVTETLAAPLPDGLAMLEGGLPAGEVLVQVTGSWLEEDDLFRDPLQAKPARSLELGGPTWDGWLLPGSPAMLGALLPPNQTPGAPASIILRLARTALSADGRDGTRLVVLVRDGRGRPVADGTAVSLATTAGAIRPAVGTTENGLLFAWLRAGDRPGDGTVQATAGDVSVTAAFSLRPVRQDTVRLDEPAAGAGPLPFNLAAVVEQAGNTIQDSGNGRPPFVERPSHRAQFTGDGLAFLPLGDNAPAGVPLTLTVAPVTATIGGLALNGGGPWPATVEGNVVRVPRGPNLVAEAVARDGGIEQRWLIPTNPRLAGDLVLAVEVETALGLARAEGGDGFVFRYVDPVTGQMTPVTGYGRALALDANGRGKRAWLVAEELEPSPEGLHRYRIEMTIPAAWLAEATYPVLVDPLLGSLLRLDGGLGQSGSQTKPSVAYNSANDEYLVVWQDKDLYGQLVDGQGIPAGDGNIVVTSDSTHGYHDPDLAYNPDEDAYLVVWSDDYDNLWGQTLQADGYPFDSIFQIDEESEEARTQPAVAYSASAGAWMVAWQAWNKETGSYDIKAQAIYGSESWEAVFTVYSGGGSDSTLPDVAANDSGGFLVVWEQAVTELFGNSDLYAQRVTIEDISGNTIELNQTGTQVAPAVTYNADDDHYLVVWQDYEDDYGGSGYDAIWGQRFYGTAAGGTTLGSAFNVEGSDGADSAVPAVTYHSALTGTYMVAWEQTIWGGSLNLQARWVLTGGTTSGSVFTVVAETNDQADVALSSGPQGTATFAAWTDGRAGDDDIHGRLIEVDGSLGNDYKLHPAAGDQVDVQVAYNADDDEYLVVWADYRSGAGNPDIFGQRVSGGGLLVGENITVTTAAYRQIEPRIAYGSGRYLVAWRHYPGASDNYYDVYGQFLYANGQPAGSVLQIANNSGALDRETPTDVVYNATSGKFLVVWQDLGNGNWDILGRHVATNGTMDTAFQISWTVSQETSAAASYNPADDEYLVVWDAGGDIAGRRLAGDGTLLGAVIDVALEEEQELAPDVAYTGAGGYTVVWFRKVDGSGSDVYGQAIASDGSLVGDNYLIAGEAQDEQNPRVVPDGSGGALVVWWRDNTGAGTGNDLYGRQLDGHGQVLESPFAILTDSDNQDQPALAGNGSGQYLLVWRDDRNGDYDVYGQLFQGALKQTVIEYAYDPLYRLIGASYTGAISATFAYDYDKVGNMRAFTETITSTTSVERFFNDANQLTTSVDASGTTTYTYDLNGNLTAISPPNAGPATAYAYDQRNLLTSATLVGQPLADYLYDGQGNRLQQVDYTGAQPIMTTYTNDIVGLSQVLVADDGTAQVVNLFGLDLIHQDDGGQTLTLLADGLGSVRGEMAGGTVQSITTYEPYGNLLAQEGTSGTVYGFTGEQEDNATGLLYLRARYYSPALKVFQSRDPWQGTGWRPETLNYYVYAGDNPMTHT
jgi:RHS repeat-associated protein